MCGKHWRMVPRALQRAVWAHYQNGQELGLARPSSEWHAAADAAIDAVDLAEHEERVASQQVALFPTETR